jgi:hypothetical protein
MRRAVIVLALLAIGGCEKESAKAERQAEIVGRTGDKAAECEAKRKVADAYLAEGNEEKYRDAKLFADVACNAVALDRLNYSGR